ncbi:MAG: RDD family protein [Bacteroidia bacterium]|jgi:uncharacterized RDD family membrane protein YckC
MNLKTIGKLTLLIAGIGIATELVKLLHANPDLSTPTMYTVMVNCLRPVSLLMFNPRLLVFHFEGINYLNLLFNALMLTGGIIFLLSNQKKIRLVRFAFSIIALNHLIMLFGNLFIQFSSLSPVVHSWIHFFMYVTVNILWFYISLKVLKTLNQTMKPATDENYQAQQKEDEFIDASKWQRFFHHVLDTFICLLLLSPLSRLSYELGVGAVERVAGQSMAIFTLLVLFSLIYFPFFETVFGATPAKFLTETRTTTSDGDKIDFKLSVLRTFCRYIPFEPFSFLGSRGWHDSISETRVIKEKGEEPVEVQA